MDNRFCIEKRDGIRYPDGRKHYSPSVRYPEYKGNEIAEEENPVYDMVRDAFLRLGFDSAHAGTPAWNPLGDVICPGETVLVKPNLVMHENPAGSMDCLVTHPSVLRAVLDYVYLALNGTGKVIVGDAPVQSCDFDRLLKDGGYEKITQYYLENGRMHGVTEELKFHDFRNMVVERTDDGRLLPKENRNNGFSCSEIHLDEDSAFTGLTDAQQDRLRITNYAPEHLKVHHHGNVHEYLVTDALLQADVIINMPKPKAHRKAGVTGALKNMVGINASKEYLPHHMTGAKEDGGDEYLHHNRIKAERTLLQEKIDRANEAGDYHTVRKLQRENFLLYQVAKRLPGTKKDDFSEGSWYGNETIGRTIRDLNRAVFYADKNGRMTEEPKRRMFVVADMIDCGQKEGPLLPEDYPLGILLFGNAPELIDLTILKLFGLLAEDIPSIGQFSDAFREREEKTAVVSNDPDFEKTSLAGLAISPEKITLSSGWEGGRERFSVS